MCNVCIVASIKNGWSVYAEWRKAGDVAALVRGRRGIA